MTLSLDITADIKQRIEKVMPGAQVEVFNSGNGHFTLSVISDVFEGLSQVKQHQLVYSAIKDLMSGPTAPIHAIDKMDLRSN